MTDQKESKYSHLQIWLAMFTGGPFIAGLLMFRNNRRAKKGRAYLALFAGVLVTLFMYFLLNIFTSGSERGGPGTQGTSNLLLRILTLVAIQAVFALMYLLYEAYISKTSLISQHREIVLGGAKRSIIGLAAMGFVLSVIYMSSGFLFTFLVIYILPNIYLYFRLKRIVNHEKAWKIISVIYIISVILYPFSEITYRITTIFPVKAALFVSYYYLVALLYYFLLLLLIDLLLLINRWIKLVPVTFLRKSKTRAITFSVVTLMVITIVTLGRLNYLHPVVDSYTVEIPKKADGLKELKIAVASDLHLNVFTTKDMVKKIVAKINSINPDLVLMVGDIIDSDNDLTYNRTYQQDFHNLHSKFGVYAVTGNHEYYGNYEKRIDFIRNSNMTLLLDSVVYVDSAFYLAGRQDRQVRTREDLKDMLAGIDTSKLMILMDHQPVNLEEAWSNGVDIQVSGHTHDGQLFPFNFITRLVYTISWGHEKIHGTDFFVSCGVQGWGPKLKTAGRAEIMEINVKLKQ